MHGSHRTSAILLAGASIGAAVVVAQPLGCSASDHAAGHAAEGAADAGPPSDAQSDAAGLEDSRVVCRTCSPQLLDAKRAGILVAMKLLEAYAGADVLPQHAPLTFHLDDDATCGTAAQMMAKLGYVTGSFFVDADGKGHCCLFDVEKTNRALAFTPANARTLPDQLLPVHEAGHAWFTGREDDERLQEPFVKMISFVLSGAIPDPCTGFRTASPPDSLIANLCDAGFVVTDLPAILARTASAAREAGRALSDEEEAQVVSDVIGHDARPAFRAAGLL